MREINSIDASDLCHNITLIPGVYFNREVVVNKICVGMLAIIEIGLDFYVIQQQHKTIKKILHHLKIKEVPPMQHFYNELKSVTIYSFLYASFGIKVCNLFANSIFRKI